MTVQKVLILYCLLAFAAAVRASESGSCQTQIADETPAPAMVSVTELSGRALKVGKLQVEPTKVLSDGVILEGPRPAIWDSAQGSVLFYDQNRLWRLEAPNPESGVVRVDLAAARWMFESREGRITLVYVSEDKSLVLVESWTEPTQFISSIRKRVIVSADTGAVIADIPAGLPIIETAHAHVRWLIPGINTAQRIPN